MTGTGRQRPHAFVICGAAIAAPLGAGVVLLAVHLALFDSSFYLGEATLIVEAVGLVAIAAVAGLITARRVGVDRPVALIGCTAGAAVAAWVVTVGLLGQAAGVVLVAAVVVVPDAAPTVTVVVVGGFAALAVLEEAAATVLLSVLFGRALRRRGAPPPRPPVLI
ncbi:hypothetical protein NVV95_14730 [Herbiconiux sp. CPCC 205716]|uniref:Uncharacterized protein n=1 Tax=Herbiconiux gentiana TaxID=2970912 RepID=A0ABT2GLJ2_9MICO|nr:hypothetical protein [Herbiconiux gentiana]MCS5715804.1 hypothetical protein [Herbiconiux gentiana]